MHYGLLNTGGKFSWLKTAAGDPHDLVTGSELCPSRLPWHRKRRKPKELPSSAQSSANSQLHSADLALIVDALPQGNAEEVNIRLLLWILLELYTCNSSLSTPQAEQVHCLQGVKEVQRLQAARRALEERLYRLDSSKGNDGGVRTPFTPLDERPWRSSSKAEALRPTIDASQSRADPTADVSRTEEAASETPRISVRPFPKGSCSPGRH